METRLKLHDPKRKGWYIKARERLILYRPRFKDWHFWAVGGLVLVLAVLHSLIELGLFGTDIESSSFIPVTLFFIPVAYAALKFGFTGSVVVAVWATIITIPNLVIWHPGMELLGEIFQMLITNAVAVFLGYWVDRERAAQRRARAYATHMINTQEKERQRIARDLHDESIQNLVLLCQELDAVKNSSALSPTAIEKLQKARQTAERAAAGLRDFTKELRPPILDDFGMVAAIRKLLMDFLDRTGADGRLKAVGEERRLPSDLELGMFRIAQEALSNIEHHARATNVTIIITFNDREANLDIGDNGKGFIVPVHPENLVFDNKLGLIGMKERAKLLGGKLEIQSSPKKGTRIKAAIPLSGNSTK